MIDLNDIINNITEKVTTAYQGGEKEAEASLCVFLLGCYCSKHKPFLEKTRDEITKKKQIVCVLMEDIKHDSLDTGDNMNYALKFSLMCDEILKSFRVPLIFMYAPAQEINCGDGHKAELVTVCENPKYETLKGNFRIFSEEGANLPHQHLSILFNVLVNSGEEFVISALKRLDIEKNMMVDILTRDKIE